MRVINVVAAIIRDGNMVFATQEIMEFSKRYSLRTII